MNWATDDHPSAAKLEGPECFSNLDLEICDMDPPPAKMAMPYMIQVPYEKPVPPDRSHGEKRKGGSIDRSVHRAGTSTKPSNSGMKQSTPMLLITDGRLGHSDLPIDDDDFVDAPPSWKGTSIHEDSPSGKRKSDDTTIQRICRQKISMLYFIIISYLIIGINVMQVVDELRNYFKGQISDLQSENRLLSKQLQAMQSQVSSLKSDQQKKLKLLVRMQGEIRTDMLDIKSHMQRMSDSVTTLISSSMEEIMNKFRDNSGPETVGGSGPTSEVGTPTVTVSYLSVTTNLLIYTSHQMYFCSDFQAAKVEKSVDSKGKAKVDSAYAVEFPCSIEPPSFGLGLGFTQPNQFFAKTSKEVEVQVDSVISNVLKDTKCIEQEHSPEATLSFGLPVKRAPKPVKALQSPYVVDEVKQMKLKKFNDKDDAIRPPFSIGQYLVGNKTWWYELVSREVSSTSSVSYYTKVTVLKGMSQYMSH
ncbi:Hypothetical predicted protein [Olea europaea subsp. europaea]|uniref:Uncharacterized protein n=1 Tax=Olea europaea subsp. europaea TaxID=158383 RepID=A0A8S0TXK4_OLEEU|nr:Hypothetical predicted protein [Olea europaea subsp. europaea]